MTLLQFRGAATPVRVQRQHTDTGLRALPARAVDVRMLEFAIGSAGDPLAEDHAADLVLQAFAQGQHRSQACSIGGHIIVLYEAAAGVRTALAAEDAIVEAHRQAVTAALEAGEDVPASVLADYPGLSDEQIPAYRPMRH